MAEKVGGDTRLASLAIMIGSDNLSLSWTAQRFDDSAGH